jgi:hypothetical protein
MDPKQVRKIVDEVCADLDRRAARTSLLGRYARPVGLGLALGLGGVAGCGSDSPSSNPDASPIVRADAGREGGTDLPQSVDLYGLTVDALQPLADTQKPLADAQQPLADTQQPSKDAAGAGAEVRKPEVNPSIDLYGLATLDGPPDARPLVDSAGDIYGVANFEARPPIDAPVDIYGAVDRGPDKPVVDAGVDTSPTVDGQALDGGALD